MVLGENFKACWSMVSRDVIAVVCNFFELAFIPPHFNSNRTILIPKKLEAESISDYRPIALANFFFMVITKILANRLGLVASRIVSPNQSAFIRGPKILQLNLILPRPLILLIGASFYGFSELLASTQEEVLRRGISQLVTQNNLDCMAAPGSCSTPSHVLFADDVMVFMQASSHGLHALSDFMEEYAANSGQYVNKEKSLLFIGRPKSKGGLNLKNLFVLNQALLLKRGWDVVSKSSPSAIFLHERFLVDGLKSCSYYKKSSVWLGLKQVFPEITASLTSHTLPDKPLSDQVVWAKSSSGMLTSKEAYNSLLPLPPSVE
ncbi:uncharacterized protein LOC112163982 [Rosa chinensis]|uniref:uncharacterized protein LOC112163982 n=1 Tax=Rosa chinensis TaxID=74649 RepID=UPI000D08BB8E|nr:uncharacterized protein LOC112163982 [Rosa chinensis]